MTRRQLVPFVCVNLNKDLPGDRRYLRSMRRRAGRPRVLALQEVGSGPESTQVRVRGLRVRRGRRAPRRLVLGTAGVHRAVDQRDVWLQGQWVRVMSGHGLHNRSVTPDEAEGWRTSLGLVTAHYNRVGVLWALGVDGNYPLSRLALELGGVAHGDGGIEGWITSPELITADRAVWTVGRDNRWSDHPEHVLLIPR